MEEGGHILVVDDNEPGRYALARTLRVAGFEVAEAATGQDCLDRVGEHAPDLIFLDVSLPDMSGIEVCQRLKGEPRTAGIPLIQMSAQFTGSRDRIVGLESGADAYLSTPIEPAEMLAQARALLRVRRTEAALRESEERFRLFMDHSPALVWVKDEQGQYVYLNRAYEQRFGVTLAQCRGKTDDHLWPPEVANRLRQADQAVFAAGRPIEVTEETTEPNGNRSFWLNTKFPFRDANGNQFIASIGLDISERKRFQEAVQESETRLRLAVETAELGTYERDLGTNEITMNEVCRAILGLGNEPPPPDVARRSVHPEDKERVFAAVARAFNPALREVCGAEFRIVRPDGSVRWVAGRGRVIFDDANEPARAARFIGVLDDITERKRAEQVLTRSREQLEQLVATRTAKLQEVIGELEHFSYSIVHDLRSPLRAMSGYAQMVDRACAESSEPQVREYLRRIQLAAHRMDRLITDALDYTKAVRQELPLERVEAARLLQGMLQTYPELHASKADIRIAGEIPAVLANPAGLTQCFSNLLGNAVKFVAPGTTPEVRVWADRDGGLVRLWVADNGIGISKEMLPRVFHMFWRGQREYEGTGIGLALVRKVVERMGGKVGVESEPGSGSRFWIELKAAVPE